VSGDKPAVVLALSPIVEQTIAPLLFGHEAAVSVSESVVELNALTRTLATTADVAEALLVSADLPELSAGLLSSARSHGLRLIGIASDEHDAALLREQPLDTILTPPIGAAALQSAIRTPTEASNGDEPRGAAAQPSRAAAREQERVGTVLAVVGSRGAPGASELACSLAALASSRWQALLVEVDLLGNAGLALRLGSDASQGSLLALLRATRSGESALAELLERWLITRTGWPPVLLAPPEPERAIDELDQPGAIRTGLDALAATHSLVIADVGHLLAEPGSISPVARCHREALLAADAVILTLGAREAQLDAGLAQLDLLLNELGIARERIRVVCNGAVGPGAIPRLQLEETLTIGLRERELATDALIPWDDRALAKAVRTGLPLTAAHPRGSYAHTLTQLLDTLFLPGAPIPRGRKRLLTLPLHTTLKPTLVSEKADEEVLLPWRS
jgi:hypothetical protein